MVYLLQVSRCKLLGEEPDIIRGVHTKINLKKVFYMEVKLGFAGRRKKKISNSYHLRRCVTLEETTEAIDI